MQRKPPPVQPSGATLSEFELERGEISRKGSQDAYGLIKPVGPAKIGPAPPYVRQVVSGYDSRPIGGYDFVLRGTFDPYLAVALDAPVQSPQGYVTVVRKITVRSESGLVLTVPATWAFSANGVVATAWEWDTGILFDEHSIDVFFVVAQNTPFALRSLTGLAGLASTVVTVVYSGNLILDTQEPPNEQVGSKPHTVKIQKD